MVVKLTLGLWTLEEEESKACLPICDQDWKVVRGAKRSLQYRITFSFVIR